MTRGRLTLAAVLAAMGMGCGAIASAAAPKSQTSQSFITFVHGGDKGPITVWIAHADGSGAHRLASGDQALLSPNGAYVAVQHYAQRGVALELYSTDGKLLTDYYDVARDTASPLRWSADSRYLLVSLASTRAVGGGELTLIDMSTQSSRVIASGAVGDASFSPTGTQIVFSRASSEKFAASENLYSEPVAGGTITPLTNNGNSFDPLWVPAGIVFDRSTSRGTDKAPAYQLWLDASGKLTQLTHMRVPALLDGLSPLAASADGNRLLAEYTGQDTSYAWTVQLSPLRIRVLKVAGKVVQGSQISADGRRLLVEVGGFEQSPSAGEVESVSFAGGSPVALGHGSQPSWNN